MTDRWTIYVDESGLFGDGDAGRKVVVALALPLPDAEVESLLGPALDALQRGKRRRPFHATDLTRLTRRYGPGGARTPSAVAAGAILTGLAATTARALEVDGAFALACLERGERESGIGRWAECVRVLLEEACVELRRRSARPPDVFAYVEQYGAFVPGAPAPSPCDPGLMDLVASFHGEIRGKERRAGLELADWMSRVLGPRGKGGLPVSDDQARSLALSSLRNQVKMAAGPRAAGATLAAGTGDPLHRRMSRLTLDPISRPALVGELLREARAREVPSHAFLACVEGTLERARET